MNKYLLTILTVFLPLLMTAQPNCNIAEQQPIKLLSAELKRGMRTFQKQKPPVYYLAYIYKEVYEQQINVSNGGVEYLTQGPRQNLTVDVRVGSVKMDNTRLLKNDRTYYDSDVSAICAIEGDGRAFTTQVWRQTQEAVELAQHDFTRVQSDSQTASARLDDSPDFVFPPADTYCHEEEFTLFNLDKIKELLLQVSTLTRGKKFILSSNFSFQNEQGHRYFINSSGTRLKTPYAYARLSYSIGGKTAEGLELERVKGYDVLSEKDLPTLAQLTADIKKSIDELEALIQAPEGEPITVPVILKNRAMGVFVHEVLGHRVEGHRQKDDGFGRTFTDKIGQQIVSPLLTISDDTTLKTFNGIPLRGYYEYDDEGVKARPVMLIENGIFKGFLMSSSPIKGFATSNGHGRSDRYHRAVARMGNTYTTASKTVSYDALEKLLLEEIRKQHKPYGLIIEDLSGGYTITQTYLPQAFKLSPTFAYRLYPDGHREVVRGIDISGTPLVSFNEVIAAADDYDVFNGTCGAESGWVPVSSTAPSVLLRAIEIEVTGKDTAKPPLLPPPASEVNK